MLINGALVALLMLVVGGQLLQLWRNLRARRLRLAARAAARAAVRAGRGACPARSSTRCPLQFLGRSIESWFDVRVDRALEGGINLGRSSLDYLLKETSNRASLIANALADASGGPGPALTRAAEQVGVYEAALYSPSGSVLAVAGVGRRA